MTVYWRCVASELPAPQRVDCDAHGEGDKAGEAHTDLTGHPVLTSTRKERP
jgi:hypothetical protein